MGRNNVEDGLRVIVERMRTKVMRPDATYRGYCHWCFETPRVGGKPHREGCAFADLDALLRAAAEPEAKDPTELESPPFKPAVVDEFKARGFERVNRKAAEPEAKTEPMTKCDCCEGDFGTVDMQTRNLCPLCFVGSPLCEQAR